MSFNCPRCNSENTQKLSLIYEMGTNSIQTTTVGAAGFDRNYGAGGAVTSGTSQNKTAAKYAPPKKEPTIGVFLTFSAIGLFFGIFWSWAPYVGIGLGAIAAYQMHQENKSYPAKMAEWQSKFLCLRCENLFTPE